MSIDDSSGSHSRQTAKEESSVFRRYQEVLPPNDDEAIGSLPVELGADGLATDVEMEELAGPGSDHDGSWNDSITAPYDPSKIEIQTLNPTIDLLMSRLREGMIDLAPDFQRRAGIWSDERQSRLIESLLLRIPIPSFYVAELADSSWVADSSWAIVDGIQRLTAIARFIAPDALSGMARLSDLPPLRLRGLEYLQKDFEGKGYQDLTGRLQIRLRETQVVVHSIRPGTPEEVKFNIFARINTGGLALTRQEIRHALIPGPARELLASLASSAEFKSATGGRVPDERMADREMVLRFLAFRLTPPEEFRPNQEFDQFLAQAMHGINRLPAVPQSELADSFLDAMRAAEDIFSWHAFRKRYPGQTRRSPVNKALFESVAVNLARLTAEERAELVRSSEAVVERFQQLMTNPQFDSAISVGTGDRLKVATRFAAIELLFHDVLSSGGGPSK